MSMDKLSPKHRVFVEAFAGDPTEAARIADLSTTEIGAKRIGKELMKEPLIIQAIQERSKYVEKVKKTIATREERQELWSQLMFNEDPHVKPETDANGLPIKQSPNIALAIRLKASELLGKSEADFVEKIDMTSKVTLTDIILGSYAKESDRSIEDIEAEYKLIRSQEKRRLQEPEDDLTETPNLDDLI